MPPETILLSHGSGGRRTHSLIRTLFLPRLNNPFLAEFSDSAVLPYKTPVAFSTDSFVVKPAIFPGGDIGTLCVSGTVNDLVVQGARPEYISLAIVAEEGLAIGLLEKVVDAIARTARAAGVRVATGDFKVVERGSCDQLFITTSGIGSLIGKKRLSVRSIRPHDEVIITGTIAEHGFAVLAARHDLQFGTTITSDCAPLNGLLIPLLSGRLKIRCMRDPTRGGLATTLKEIAEGSGRGIEIDERRIPVSAKIKAASEMLGIDPLYVACEGRAVVIVAPEDEQRVLRLLRRHPLGRKAQTIGKVVAGARGEVVLTTVAGTHRLIDMLESDPLPRIC